METFFKCDIPVLLGNNYCENGKVRAQLFWLRLLLLEGRHVSAPLLGHPKVTKNILKVNYVCGNITVRVILQRYLVVTFVAEMSKVMAIKVPNLMFNPIYTL
jgi:hypothetical protein